MNYISRYNSPLGAMTAASDGKSLTGLWFDNQKCFLSGLNVFSTDNSLSIFKRTFDWLDIYFSGKNPGFLPPINIGRLSSFGALVCRIMLGITYGTTETYGNIAKRIAADSGKPASAQAVGGAVGHNPVSIIIPCHRVVGYNGNLTGYAGGIDKKVALLRLEGVDITKFSMPRQSKS